MRVTNNTQFNAEISKAINRSLSNQQEQNNPIKRKPIKQLYLQLMLKFCLIANSEFVSARLNAVSLLRHCFALPSPSRKKNNPMLPLNASFQNVIIFFVLSKYDPVIGAICTLVIKQSSVRISR